MSTRGERVRMVLCIAVLVALPFVLNNYWLGIANAIGIAAIGAIGLNIITGYAGQVSLGHAFFLAIGAYTAAVISGNPDGRAVGLGVQEILIWLPAALVMAGALLTWRRR